MLYTLGTCMHTHTPGTCMHMHMHMVVGVCYLLYTCSQYSARMSTPSQECIERK